MQAIWQGHVIADSDDTIYIEGNQYFPPNSVNMKFLKRTDLTTECFWKGTATYFTLDDGKNVAENAAWDYQKPMAGSAEKVKKDFTNYIAFYPQHVKVQ